MVSSNLLNMVGKSQSHKVYIIIKSLHHTITIAITSFAWAESDRAIYKELELLKRS